MSKTYNIETVQDMIDCTNESNIDGFIKDLKNMLVSSHVIRDTLKSCGSMVSDGFTWVDDGKNNLSIDIETIND